MPKNEKFFAMRGTTEVRLCQLGVGIGAHDVESSGEF